MNSSVLKGLAIFLAIAALGTAWMGYQMSTHPSAKPTPPRPLTYPQVVAAHALHPGQLLLAQDMKVMELSQRDPQGFSNPQDIIGKVLTVPVAENAVLRAGYFPVLSKIASALKPEERAVAIKVNEVVGVGGYLRPGDHVDVLLYLRPDRETANTSSAQMLLADVRVLAYGEELNDPASADISAIGQTTASAEKPSSLKSINGRAAILAVLEKDVAKLMLADSTGALRLALRGVEVPTTTAHQGQIISLNELGAKSGSAPPITEGAHRLGRRPIKKVQAERDDSVILYQGDQVEVVHVE